MKGLGEKMWLDLSESDRNYEGHHWTKLKNLNLPKVS